jgi:hypothetical protein
MRLRPTSAQPESTSESGSARRLALQGQVRSGILLGQNLVPLHGCVDGQHALRLLAAKGKPPSPRVVRAAFARTSNRESESMEADPPFGRLARLVRPLAARRSCCSAAAVYGVAGVTSREGMAAATVRYATCHKHAGRDVACCSHHPPCATCHSARARDMPDATRQDGRLRGCGGRPAHFPAPMRAVRARLVQATHRAAHSTRCGAAASAYRAPSGMQRATGNTVHRAIRAGRGTCRRCVVHLCHTPSQPKLTGTTSCVCAGAGMHARVASA